jgi:hypothetical protein
MTLNMDPRAEEGSFADRLKKSTLQPLQLLKVLKEEVESMAVTWPFHEEVQHLEVGSVVAYCGRYQWDVLLV